MYLKSVHLVNYRGIEDLTVNFGAGVNLIIGNNGAGKSSLLGGVSVALGSLLAWVENVGGKEIIKDDIRMVSTLVGNVTESVTYCTPVSVECKLEFCGVDYEYTCIKENEVSSTWQKREPRAYEATKKMKELVNDRSSCLPLLSYQGDGRQFFISMKRVNQPSGQIERRQGYKDCLKGTGSVGEMQDWCAQMDYAGYRLGHEATEYVLFKKIVSRFIMELEGKNDICVEFSPKLNRLVYSEGEKGYLVYNLSAGYQSVLCLVMELAYRTAILNPSLNNMESLEGVSVIDEIDMHLHPRWQWKILSALRATFPKVQFIIATHSPIVISSAENAKLILMENPNKVKELADAYGNNVGEVLALTQGSSEMPEEVKKWRHEIEQALDENDLRKAEKIIQATAERLGETSSTVQSMRDFLEVNKWIVDDE